MKKTLVLFLFLLFSLLLQAQAEQFDIATYTPPKDWVKNSKEGVVIYSKSDPKTGGFCIIALYAATPSAGTAQKDFENEWKELAVSPFNAAPDPVTEKQTTPDGWEAIAAAAAGKQDGIDSYVVLTVFSGFGKTTSVLANLNDQSYVAELDQFLQNLQLDKEKTVAMTTTLTTNTDTRISGKWAKSASSPPQYNNGVLVNLVNTGYSKGQYDFKPDGTYNFHSESMFSYNDYNLVDESGRYSVSGSQLSLTPSKSELRKVDANGTVKKSQVLPLTKREYSWQLHYFEGIGETNLVLSSVAENILDGAYGGNSRFPNSFLYSQKFVPEWKFKPQ